MVEDSKNGGNISPMEQNKAAVKECNNSGDSSQVSKVVSDASSDEMSGKLIGKLKSEYVAISKALTDCREEVKSSITTESVFSKVDASFEKAGKKVNKRWNEVVKAVSFDSNEREARFLESVGLRSLIEAETVLRENREEVEQWRQLIENVKELGEVEDIPSLFVKMDAEREDFRRELSGWESVRAEFHELAGVMKLEENERFIDRWHSMNDELQLLTGKIDRMKVQAGVEEGRLLFCKNKIEQLEKQNMSLLREQQRIADQPSQSMRADSTKYKGQMSMCPMSFPMSQSEHRVHSGSGIRNINGVLGKSVGMLANALTEMEKYSGKKEDWDDFETGFMIRYGGMDSRVAMSLLKDNLEGEAKDALRGIPVEEKAKGVSCVLKWLRSRLSNETPFEEIELERMLRHQSVEGKTVGKICEELEEVTAKLNGNDCASTEAARKRQLLILYEGMHVEHARLLSLFREGASYYKMKDALVELEYLRMTELRIPNHRGINSERRYDNGIRMGVACDYGGHGHEEYQCTSRREEGYEVTSSGPQGGVEMISRNSDQ